MGSSSAPRGCDDRSEPYQLVPLDRFDELELCDELELGDELELREEPELPEDDADCEGSLALPG